MYSRVTALRLKPCSGSLAKKTRLSPATREGKSGPFIPRCPPPPSDSNPRARARGIPAIIHCSTPRYARSFSSFSFIFLGRSMGQEIRGSVDLRFALGHYRRFFSTNGPSRGETTARFYSTPFDDPRSSVPGARSSSPVFDSEALGPRLNGARKVLWQVAFQRKRIRAVAYWHRV